MTTINADIESATHTHTAIDAFKAELAAQHLPEPSLITSEPHPLNDLTHLPSPAMYEARRAALATMARVVLYLSRSGCLSISIYYSLPNP